MSSSHSPWRGAPHPWGNYGVRRIRYDSHIPGVRRAVEVIEWAVGQDLMAMRFNRPALAQEAADTLNKAPGIK